MFLSFWVCQQYQYQKADFVFQEYAIVSVVQPSRAEPLLPVYLAEGENTPVELPVALPVFVYSDMNAVEHVPVELLGWCSGGTGRAQKFVVKKYLLQAFDQW